MGSGNSVNGQTHWPEEDFIGQLQQCVMGKIIGQCGGPYYSQWQQCLVFPFGRPSVPFWETLIEETRWPVKNCSTINGTERTT